MVSNVNKPLSILSLLLEIRETNPTYNEFSLPLSHQQHITMCTYFASSISVPKEITVFEGDGTFRGFFRQLRAALDGRHYDIVHAHTPHVALLFLLASPFTSGKLFRNTVYTVHNSYRNYKLRNKLMLYPIFALFGGVVCCSNSSLESIPRLLRWLAGMRISAVQNGVDIDRVDRVLRTVPKPIRKKRFTVLAIGRLIEIKEPVTVLNAFERGNDRKANLVLIGEGPLRGVLTAEIKKLGLESKASLTGLIPRNEVFSHLATADLFISASRGEGLPVAVLEAMASNCPVVLSDIASHREIAAGADFIPLIASDNTTGFAKEITRFQSMSSSERSIVGSRCRELVENRFSLAAMHRGYEKVYLQLIDKHHPHASAYVLNS